MTNHDIKINNKKNFHQPPSLVSCQLQSEAQVFSLGVVDVSPNRTYIRWK